MKTKEITSGEVYLPNGQTVWLKEKIGNRYIINKIYEYETEHGWDASYGEDMLVDTVYFEKPIEKFDKEIAELIQKRDGLTRECDAIPIEIRKLNNDLSSIKKNLITQNSFIINKSELINAKSIAFFVKDQIMPSTLKSDKFSYGGFRGLKISMEISISTGEERSWGYKIWYEDDRYSSGDFLDPKEGIIINPTEEILNEIIHRRVREVDIKDQYLEHKIRNVPEHYLTTELLEIKRNIESEKLSRELEEKQRELKKISDQIENLKVKITPNLNIA